MPDLDALLIDSPLRSVTIPSNTFLISPSSGQPLNITSSFRDAFLESAAEIFQRPMRWERIEASLKAFILQASFKQTNSRISIMGLTGVSKLLRAAFGTTRMRVVADEDAQTGAENPGSDANDIAIVGMAGRFPGAESLEDFWQTLEKGLDLHRRVRIPNCLKIDFLIHKVSDSS